MKKLLFWAIIISLGLQAFAQELPKTEIIAHRGASYLAPENTVASAKLAFELGADAVECDIHLSKDGKIMVCHDGNTKRASGQDYVISQTSSKTLRKLDVGSLKDPKYKGEKIPFLTELIKVVPAGKELVIEIKSGPEIFPELKKTIDQSPKDRKYTFIAFDFETICQAKKIFPGKSCYWLCSERGLLNKNKDSVKSRGLDGLSLSYYLINESIASEARKSGYELFAWTVDDPEEALRLLDLGGYSSYDLCVKGITTDRPGWLQEEMKRINSAPLPVVEIIAHRGASELAPENTVASAKLAYELNADAVECDLTLSKEGRIIISHDGNTIRTSGKNYAIKDTPVDTLRKLDVGSWKGPKYKGEKMPFVDELIAVVPQGKKLVIEMRSAEALGELKGIVERSPKNISLVFIGFSFETMCQTKKTFPDRKCYWLCGDTASLNKNKWLVKENGLDGVSLTYQIVDKKAIADAKSIGYDVYAWTINRPLVAKRLIRLGVKGITTNQPDYLRHQIYGN